MNRPPTSHLQFFSFLEQVLSYLLADRSHLSNILKWCVWFLVWGTLCWLLIMEHKLPWLTLHSPLFQAPCGHPSYFPFLSSNLYAHFHNTSYCSVRVLIGQLFYTYVCVKCTQKSAQTWICSSVGFTNQTLVTPSWTRNNIQHSGSCCMLPPNDIPSLFQR